MHTDLHGLINSAHPVDHLYILFIGSPTFSAGCNKLCDKLIFPARGIKVEINIASYALL